MYVIARCITVWLPSLLTPIQEYSLYLSSLLRLALHCISHICIHICIYEYITLLHKLMHSYLISKSSMRPDSPGQRVILGTWQHCMATQQAMEQASKGSPFISMIYQHSDNRYIHLNKRTDIYIYIHIYIPTPTYINLLPSPQYTYIHTYFIKRRYIGRASV